MEGVSLKDFISSTLQNVKEGTSEEFTIQGPIEFELSVIAVRGENGRVDVEVIKEENNLNLSKELKQEIKEIQKIKFKIFNKKDVELRKGLADIKAISDENDRRWSVGYTGVPPATSRNL